MSLISLIIFLIFPIITHSAHLGSPSIKEYGVELKATNFNSVLKNTPATFAIVEFYAHWCPACRNYKPQYEKVARLFNGPQAVNPGILLMTRVDCALKVCRSVGGSEEPADDKRSPANIDNKLQDSFVSNETHSPWRTPSYGMQPIKVMDKAIKMNSDLCDNFSVSQYPMLFWGPTIKFVDGGWKPKQDKSDICLIDDGRTADRLLKWINKKLGRHRALEGKDGDLSEKSVCMVGGVVEVIVKAEMISMKSAAQENL